MTDVQRSERAMELFSQGYNCAQSVVLAFADVLDTDEATLAKTASSFGGGLGGLREVCGCVSGMAIVAGMLRGYFDSEAKEEKKEHYAFTCALADEFKAENGSIICRELLSGETLSRIPGERTAEYYKKRPCKELVGIAAAILQRKLDEIA